MQQKTVACLVENIKKFKSTTKTRIDAIAIRGNSGAIMGGIVSYLLGIPLFCIRKKESSHSVMKIEGYFNKSRGTINYIIIDDLISTGETMDAIMDSLDELVQDHFLLSMYKFKPKAIFLYNQPQKSAGKEFYHDDINTPIIAFQLDH